METIEPPFDDLIFSKHLGKITFLSYKKGIPTKYATKIINKQIFIEEPKSKEYFDNEITILKDIHHQNVENVIEIKESPEKIYLVTEYYNGGNLDDYLQSYIEKNNKPFSEEIVQYIMRQIFDAMKYLHNKRIIHRKLCLHNIMINYEDENDRINENILKAKIIIVDFGFAKYLKKGELTRTTLGIPLNMDPILLNKLKKEEGSEDAAYDEKVDIWSLGTIFYELLVGHSAFDSDNMEELLNKVNKGEYFIPLTLSKEAISFLNYMLQHNPKKRLSVEKLINHKFLKKNVKEFSKININELKDLKLIDNSTIKINTENNELIFVFFGSGIESNV